MYTVNESNAAHHILKIDEPIKVQDFCVLTGPNGSGKSSFLVHLMSSATDSVTNRKLRAQYLKPGMISPDKHGATSTILSLGKDKREKQMKQHFDVFKSETIDGFRLQCDRHGYLDLYDAVEQIYHRGDTDIKNISFDEIKKMIVMGRERGNFFNISVARAFVRYHLAWEKNRYNKFLNGEGDDCEYLSEEEFFSQYGAPPWDLVNDVFESNAIPYKINNPTHIRLDRVNDSFAPALYCVHTNRRVNFNVLSSGEKVIVALLMSVYSSTVVGKPELILLDEPDASLHPDYASILVSVLKDVFVDSLGIRVMMTTHSPSTVAIAPENAIYEMYGGVPRKVSKRSALNTLTKHISHLRVSYDDRRLIFVEGKDVCLYEQIFDMLDGFGGGFGYSATFAQPKPGDTNCTDIINLVRKMNEGGRKIAYGIIDYDNGMQDGAYKDGDGIHILGGQRYAIENYVLDPLLVFFTLAFNGTIKMSSVEGWEGGFSVVKLDEFGVEELNLLIKYMMNKIGLEYVNTVGCELMSGLVVEYPKAFFEMNGHRYAKLLADKVKETGDIHKGQPDDKFMPAMIKRIQNYPQFLPRELATLFVKIGEDQ